MDEVIRAKRQQTAGSGHARDHHSRRARAQSQERRRRNSARQAGGVHRPVRLRQIVARLRHHLCRGPAPLRRIAVGLCAPVPGDDAEARRRPDRRPVAGDFHRAEDHLEEPALDRRHRHRDLRLHAAVVGAGRRALFARDAACRSRARSSRRWSTACWRCPRARGSICWRRSCAAARASTGRSSPNTSRRDFSASRSTARSTSWPKRRRSTRNSRTTSTSWWTASWCGRTSASGWRKVLRPR